MTNEEKKFANIIVDISHESVDRPFCYRIPEALREQIKPGMQVKIPFGNGNSERKGFVMELLASANYPEDKIKDIASIVEGGVVAEGRLIALAAFIKEQYGSTFIAALKTVLPVKEKVRAISMKEICVAASEEEIAKALDEAVRRKHVAKQRLLEALSGRERISHGFAVKELGVSAKTIQVMQEKGLIRVEEKETYRNPVKVNEKRQEEIRLNEEQQHVVADFCAEYHAGKRGMYLIHGVTGAGKTEVYMEMMDAVLKSGKEVILLIPEISLTYQTVLRFYRRFGDVISVVHSKLSKGEKYDQFQRAAKGEIKIMIGPRSALFTPFNNLGLIIIDEEHEGSYKSENMPKYHAREVAEHMAHVASASLVLGSATPSITSYYRAQNGEIKLYELTHRYKDRALPDVSVVDLREELKNGNRSMFSRSLQEKMKERLQKNEQTMLFINRRGYESGVLCRSCGDVVKCPHCDVSLTVHKARGAEVLRCHYCGYETPKPEVCPKCGAPARYMSGLRLGTQKVVEALHKTFPTARVLQMDRDTTKTKDSYEQILSAFAAHEADILVGTQMIVKGHDFPDVTLVGILVADLSLSAGDYRATERTFELLTQAIGRAGRGEKPGEALLQTYQPEDETILQSAAQDYKAHYESEIAYRKLGGYPPVSSMLAIQLASANEELLTEFAKEVKEVVATGIQTRAAQAEASGEEAKAFFGRPTVIGPANAMIYRIDDVYRKVLYVRKGKYPTLVGLKDDVEAFCEENRARFANCVINFDFNPMNGF
ncbi:MAG: primosomal protein N' [Lachnospiraceae bacterium]|nr:primosomal protein N' [Lachnospiraceae bacterium]